MNDNNSKVLYMLKILMLIIWVIKILCSNTTKSKPATLIQKLYDKSQEYNIYIYSFTITVIRHFSEQYLLLQDGMQLTD